MADRARRSGNAPFILGLTALVVLAKLPTLHAPAYWDEFQFHLITSWLFVEQYRWICSVAILVDLAPTAARAD